MVSKPTVCHKYLQNRFYIVHSVQYEIAIKTLLTPTNAYYCALVGVTRVLTLQSQFTNIYLVHVSRMWRSYSLNPTETPKTLTMKTTTA